MAELPLPAHVERFLTDHVPSVAHLEALLLMREDSAQRWTVNDIAERLYIGVPQARTLASRLRDHGFLDGDGATWSFAPSPALAAELDLVAEVYRKRLIAVSRFVHALQDSNAARAFADAFRVRKD
jgi:DNA-binding IclR family transcriptional regulator